MTLPPRVDVSAVQIADVVAAFYARVRRDPQLAPVFAAHVDDWPAHEAKIASFWRNALLYERVYDGNPMQKHMAAGNVSPQHFGQWLAHFDAVLHESLSTDIADAWSLLAHRIGHGLRFGLEAQAGSPPNLRL
jgi:hemoglobin